MLRKLLQIVMVLLVLMVAAPAMAQDGGIVVTEQTSWWNTPAVVAIVLGFVFMVAGGVLAFFSAPPWMVRLMIEGAQKSIDKAREDASVTPTKIDDLLVGGGDAALNFAIQLLKQRGYNIIDPSQTAIDKALYGGTAQYGSGGDVLPDQAVG